ncbi:MAG: hypothetical protein JKY37_13595 [Nannocystaceae bacterium]|nr:hypothetical protein [Nannocystaceae bacterium]
MASHGGGELPGCATLGTPGLMAAHGGGETRNTGSDTAGRMVAQGGGAIRSGAEMLGCAGSSGIVLVVVASPAGATMARVGDGGSTGGVGPADPTMAISPTQIVDKLAMTRN